MADLDRYARQLVLAQIGEQGQQRLLAATAVVIGCGALGSNIASSLVRAGVGTVRVVDRDFVELNNLQRQVLFEEEDVARALPKAIAAAERLRRVNSQVQVEPVVTDVNPDNVEHIVAGADVVLDGTDNFETRLLINDACVKHGIPWIYGGAVATYGMTMAIRPHETPCFRCFVNDLPAPGSTPTCDTVGVLGSTASAIAALQVAEAIKILTGDTGALHGKLLYVDVWAGTLDRLEVGTGGDPCPACELGQFDYLEGRQGSWASALCGRDAVQVNVRREGAVDLGTLAGRLRSVGEVAFNDYMLRLRVADYEVNVFPDGRAIIKGCTDLALARALYARYVGL